MKLWKNIIQKRLDNGIVHHNLQKDYKFVIWNIWFLIYFEWRYEIFKDTYIIKKYNKNNQVIMF